MNLEALLRRSDFTALYARSPEVGGINHKYIIMNQDMIGELFDRVQVYYYPMKGARISQVRPTLLDDTVFFVEKDIET